MELGDQSQDPELSNRERKKREKMELNSSSKQETGITPLQGIFMTCKMDQSIQMLRFNSSNHPRTTPKKKVTQGLPTGEGKLTRCEIPILL